jgi:beta-galactosidase
MRMRPPGAVKACYFSRLVETTDGRLVDGGHGRRVALSRGGLVLDGVTVPLYAGSVHYWRLDPSDWRACLEATKAMGARLIDTYIPWGVHETAPGVLELGRTDPQRDVGAFLRLAHELGLYVIARPGPHINAELTYFGIPERVVWDPNCQARSPKNNPVMLPMVPFAFPVPSYASEAFLDEATRYFHALGPTLAPLVYPNGPIVLLQVDNEGALYFRDGAYDQDYHPDAIAQYRAFLRAKYKNLDALQAAYGSALEAKPETLRKADGKHHGKGESAASEEMRFATILPPARFDAKTPSEVARHVDWAEFHEHLLTTAFERFNNALEAAGLSGIPTTHNFPLGQEATPLNAGRVSGVVDLVGLDYYHSAGSGSRTSIARRTTELAVRSEGHHVPAFACELGAGFPPFFPPLEEHDSAFTLLTGLAYGLRGFNIYMAVERDRWIGAPIDRHGRARPFAAFWRRLTAALEATRFHELHRATPVRILTPRSERRLTRAMHAFGPISGAFFSVIGGGARASCAEDDLGLGYPIAIDADAFARTVELALETRGVPFAHIGGEDREVSLEGAKWLICATSGGMNPELFRRLERASQKGTIVTLGPRAPMLDGALRPLQEPLDPRRLLGTRELLPAVIADDPAAVDAAVARMIDALGLPTYACDPEGVFATVHEDDAGRPRVLFVLNPGQRDVLARVSFAPKAQAIGAQPLAALDPLEETRFELRHDSLEVRMRPGTVRMLVLEGS